MTALASNPSHPRDDRWWRRPVASLSGPAAALLLAGCTTVTQQQHETVGVLPGPAITSFTPALHCVRQTLTGIRSKGGSLPKYLLVIDRIKDDTIREESFATGPLSEGGEKWLSNAFKVALADQVQVPISTPQTVRAFFNSGTPLGGQLIEQFRQIYKVDGVLAINGGFTVHDDGTFDRGSGASGAYDDDENLYQLGYARSRQNNTISADVALGEPFANYILRTYSMTIRPEQTSSTVTVELGYNGFGFSMQNQDIVVDGTHNAQKTLMEAMAFRIVTDLFDLPFEMCLYAPTSGPGHLIERMAALRATPEWEQQGLVAQALRDRGYYDVSAGTSQGGADDDAFRRAAESFLQARHLPPIPASDLARLYLYILVAQPEARPSHDAVASPPQAERQQSAAGSPPAEAGPQPAETRTAGQDRRQTAAAASASRHTPPPPKPAGLISPPVPAEELLHHNSGTAAP